MAAIDAAGLTTTFGDETAVDDLSFAVEEGELFGLLGPNGAGKSTLINMLVTLLRPDAGTATVDGHDITNETAAVRNSLGIVFQEPALDEEYSHSHQVPRRFRRARGRETPAKRGRSIHRPQVEIGHSSGQDAPGNHGLLIGGACINHIVSVDIHQGEGGQCVTATTTGGQRSVGID